MQLDGNAVSPCTGVVWLEYEKGQGKFWELVSLGVWDLTTERAEGHERGEGNGRFYANGEGWWAALGGGADTVNGAGLVDGENGAKRQLRPYRRLGKSHDRLGMDTDKRRGIESWGRV